MLSKCTWKGHVHEMPNIPAIRKNAASKMKTTKRHKIKLPNASIFILSTKVQLKNASSQLKS